MKNTKGLNFLIFIGCFAFLNSASAAVIDFSPSSTTVDVGDAFSVDVVISDLYASDGSREIVSAFDLDVLYDSTVLDATGVTFGASLGDELLFEVLNVAVLSSGRVDFAALSWLWNDELLALQSEASFTLATISFEALTAGSSFLTFDPDIYPGVDVKGLDPWTPFDLSNSTGQGQVTVNAAVSVPEPSLVLLMITGLLGLGLARRNHL